VLFDGTFLSHLPVAARKGLHGTTDHPRTSSLPYISQAALGANHVSATWIFLVIEKELRVERGSHDPFFTGDVVAVKKNISIFEDASNRLLFISSTTGLIKLKECDFLVC